MESVESQPSEKSVLSDAPFWPSGRLLGHIEHVGQDPLNTMIKAHRDYGEIVRIRLGPLPAFFIFDPAAVKEALITKADDFDKTTRGYNKLRLFLGNGLVTSEGSFWRRQRRIAQPAFYRKSIAGFATTMTQTAEDLVEKWAAIADSGQIIDMADAMRELTLKIAGETLMSVDMTGDAKLVAEAMDVAMERFMDYLSSPIPYPEYMPTPANYKFWTIFARMKKRVADIITERRDSGDEVHDLLGMFMAAEDPETGERMTDQQLRDEVLTMLSAGHDTTSNALVWTLHELARHPAVVSELEAELDAVLGGRTPSIEDIPKLQYTAQVVKESMRVYPPVWIVGRQAKRKTSLGGYKIPKGAYIFLPQWALHRHPKYWDNPEAFDPSRFAPDKPQPDRFLYMPFNRGQRQCIGDRFAEMELVLVLATLAQQYRFHLDPDHVAELEPSVTLRPKNGLPMRITRRTP